MEAQATPQIFGPDGQPVEMSARRKHELQQEGIRQLFERHARQQSCQVATLVLARTTREEVAKHSNLGQLKTGSRRMAFALCFQIRERFLITSRTPPAWVHDRHRPISERRRREIIRQFRDRPDAVAHRAASQIIGDAEFSGSIVDTWRNAFEEAANADKVSKAIAGDARPGNTGAEVAAEAAREGDVSLGDASRES